MASAENGEWRTRRLWTDGPVAIMDPMSMKALLPIVVILAIVALGAYWLWPRTTGTVTIGSSTETITSCQAGFGSRPTLFGVHLKTDGGTDIFVHDGKLVAIEPAQLELTQRGGAPVEIAPGDCTMFASALGWGGGNIYSDTLSHANGSVSAECRLADGTALRVEANVRRCGLE